MTNKNKIWYPEEVEKAINDFYKGIKERGKGKRTEVKTKLNNKEADFSITQTMSYNFPNISTLITPQVGVLSLF